MDIPLSLSINGLWDLGEEWGDSLDHHERRPRGWHGRWRLNFDPPASNEGPGAADAPALEMHHDPVVLDISFLFRILSPGMVVGVHLRFGCICNEGSSHAKGGRSKFSRIYRGARLCIPTFPDRPAGILTPNPAGFVPRETASSIRIDGVSPRTVFRTIFASVVPTPSS